MRTPVLPRYTLFVMAVLCATAPRARAQVGSTTDIIMGKVTSPDGAPVVGANWTMYLSDIASISTQCLDVAGGIPGVPLSGRRRRRPSFPPPAPRASPRRGCTRNTAA